MRRPDQVHSPTRRKGCQSRIPEPLRVCRRHCGSDAVTQVFGGEGVEVVLLVMLLGAIWTIDRLDAVKERLRALRSISPQAQPVLSCAPHRPESRLGATGSNARRSWARFAQSHPCEWRERDIDFIPITCILPPPCSTEGVVMRRHFSGAGGGSLRLGLVTPTPGGSGHRVGRH